MKKITLGPYDIHINKTRFEDDTFGEYKSFPSPVIMIDDRLSPKIESLTILHEIIEAIIDIYDLPLDECHVRVLEMSLGQIIKNNPDVIKDIFDAIQA